MKLYNIYTHKHNKNKIMNINEVRSIIRQTIAEAIEEKKGGLPKSGNTLVELKKELKSLKGMQEAMGQFNLSEGGDGGFVAEYAHMQKFVNEFNKLKDAHSKLSEMLGNQIGMTEERIEAETKKIKELMGLVPKESAKKDKKIKKESDPAGEKMAGNPEEEKMARDSKIKREKPTKPAAKKAEKKDK
jgi:flagellar biosynthesis chaperone FliJ